MPRQLRSRKRDSAKSPSDDCEVSPHKKMMVAPTLKEVTVLDLPEQVFHQILSHTNLHQLGFISQVCRQFIAFTISFLQTKSSIPVLFPSMTSPAADKAMVKFFISGSEKQHGLDMTKVSNFRILGLTVKRLTCFLPTKERVMLSTKLMSRLSLCTTSSPSSKLMSLCGVFLHQLVLGWTDDECVLTAGLVFSLFNTSFGGNSGVTGSVSTLLDPLYQLGYKPELEMYVRNFLFSVFYKEVPSEQRILWLDSLLLQASPLKNISTMSKVLLLISSPAKEDELQFGVQWEDHVEAIPASYAVASSRYITLVALIRIIEEGQFGHLIPSLLFSMFDTPSPWLPENVGSVLLLLGQKTCQIYLQHIVRQVTTKDVCTTCTLKHVSTAVTGLALMTARFRRPFVQVMDRLAEVVVQVPSMQREDLFRALWKYLAEEVADLRQSEEEDWAMEGSMHLFKVIRMIGQMMTDQAYMHLPGVNEEREIDIEE